MSKQTNKFFYRLETVSLLIEICYWTYKIWRIGKKNKLTEKTNHKT